MKLGKRGDTIVEVLLAMVVVSATLGGAFATMDRGAKGTRASQERSEALKIAESQVERLKYALKDNATAIPVSGSTFCIRPDGSYETVLTSPACTPGTIPGGYRISIARDALNIFVVSLTWDNFLGSTDQLELKYKAAL